MIIQKIINLVWILEYTDIRLIMSTIEQFYKDFGVLAEAKEKAGEV